MRKEAKGKMRRDTYCTTKNAPQHYLLLMSATLPGSSTQIVARAATLEPPLTPTHPSQSSLP